MALAGAAISAVPVEAVATPLEFAPVQASIEAPPYPTSPVATQVSTKGAYEPETLERFEVTVQAVDAVNPAAALPIAVVAPTSGRGDALTIEIRWSPAGQEPFPDELLLDLRIGLASAATREPSLVDVSSGTVVRHLLVTIAAELEDLDNQRESVYADHFVDVATGSTFDAEIFDPEVGAIEFDPPLVRVAFRLARDGPSTPAPEEPIATVTASGTTTAPPGAVPTLPVLGLIVLVAALLGAECLSKRLGTRATSSVSGGGRAANSPGRCDGPA